MLPIAAKVSNIKAELFKKTSIPIERQRLILKGKALVNDKSISEYCSDPSTPLRLHLIEKAEEAPVVTERIQPSNQEINPGTGPRVDKDSASMLSLIDDFSSKHALTREDLELCSNFKSLIRRFAS